MAKGKSQRVNTSPLTARNGKVYIDKVEVADSCKFTVVFKPDVWSGKQLNSRATSRRWTGYDIEVTIEQWKTNKNYRRMVDDYVKTGRTPEFRISGTQEDKNSDFYDNEGKDKIVCVGCVPTGDINLMEMDTEGDVVKESITFGAHKLA